MACRGIGDKDFERSLHNPKGSTISTFHKIFSVTIRMKINFVMVFFVTDWTFHLLSPCRSLCGINYLNKHTRNERKNKGIIQFYTYFSATYAPLCSALHTACLLYKHQSCLFYSYNFLTAQKHTLFCFLTLVLYLWPILTTFGQLHPEPIVSFSFWRIAPPIKPRQIPRRSVLHKRFPHVPRDVRLHVLLSSFCPETALFRNLGVNLRICLCGVKCYASVQMPDFLDLV